jgi:hypothetical protein
MVLLNNRYKEDLIHYFNFVYRQSKNAVPQPITRGALYRYCKASIRTQGHRTAPAFPTTVSDINGGMLALTATSSWENCTPLPF